MALAPAAQNAVGAVLGISDKIGVSRAREHIPGAKSPILSSPGNVRASPDLSQRQKQRQRQGRLS